MYTYILQFNTIFFNYLIKKTFLCVIYKRPHSILNWNLFFAYLGRFLGSWTFSKVIHYAFKHKSIQFITKGALPSFNRLRDKINLVIYLLTSFVVICVTIMNNWVISLNHYYLKICFGTLVFFSCDICRF